MMKPAEAEYHEELVAATATEMGRLLQENSDGARRPLCPVGGRTGLGYGFPVAANSLMVSTSRLDEVVDFPARDMTVTVGAGRRVDQLQKDLASEGLRLPVDVAQSHRATIGGAIASNTSGPRRYGHGTLRDYVIGIRCVSANGQIYSGGGRVVKNVAGYDLCKLLVGSQGSLGVIFEVTLKLRPQAPTTLMSWSVFDDAASVEAVLSQLVTSAARPVAVELLGEHAATQVLAEAHQDRPLGRMVLCVAVEGSEHQARWQADVLEEELAANGVANTQWAEGQSVARLLTILTDFELGLDVPLSFRASLPPSKVVGFCEASLQRGVVVQAHAGNGVVVGHLSDEILSAPEANDVLSPLRELAEEHSGQLHIERCEVGWHDDLLLWGRARADWEMMLAVKQQLDPKGLLCPGRGIEAAMSQAARGMA